MNKIDYSNRILLHTSNSFPKDCARSLDFCTLTAGLIFNERRQADNPCVVLAKVSGHPLLFGDMEEMWGKFNDQQSELIA